MPDLELPPLHMGAVDAPTALRILDDIERAAVLLEVVPKLGPRERAPAGTLDLATARALVAGRAVRGLQLRYRFDGAEWWDTLLQQGDGWRIVRIRHEFPPAVSDRRSPS